MSADFLSRCTVGNVLQVARFLIIYDTMHYMLKDASQMKIRENKCGNQVNNHHVGHLDYLLVGHHVQLHVSQFCSFFLFFCRPPCLHPCWPTYFFFSFRLPCYTMSATLSTSMSTTMCTSMSATMSATMYPPQCYLDALIGLRDADRT